jgi:hypothetical protein
MPNHNDVLRQLSVWLLGQHKPSQYSGDAADLFNRVSDTYKAFKNDYDIERHFKEASGNVDFGDRFIYLQAMTNKGMFLPAIQIKYEFDPKDNKEKWKFYLLVFSMGATSPNSIGIRYESPEGEKGPHHFYHMQLVTRVFDHPLPGCPVWLPTSEPAFPVDADGPIKLFLCLVLSVYGANRLYGVPSSVPAFKAEIEESLMSMHFMQVVPLFFRMCYGKNIAGVKANRLQAPKLKEIAQHHKDVTLTEMSRGDYYALADKQRLEYAQGVDKFAQIKSTKKTQEKSKKRG